MMMILDDSHPINPKIHWMASSHGWEEAIDTEMINNTNARWRIIFLQNAKWFSSELFSYDFILFYSSIKGWVIKKGKKLPIGEALPISGLLTTFWFLNVSFFLTYSIFWIMQKLQKWKKISPSHITPPLKFPLLGGPSLEW